MVDIGIRDRASVGLAFGAARERVARLIAGLREEAARREAVIEMQHNLDPARLADLGVMPGRDTERTVARMMRFGLR